MIPMSRMSGRKFAPRDGFKASTLNLMHEIGMSRYVQRGTFEEFISGRPMPYLHLHF
jgi:hypothetical protein